MEKKKLLNKKRAALMLAASLSLSSTNVNAGIFNKNSDSTLERILGTIEEKEEEFTKKGEEFLYGLNDNTKENGFDLSGFAESFIDNAISKTANTNVFKEDDLRVVYDAKGTSPMVIYTKARIQDDAYINSLGQEVKRKTPDCIGKRTTTTYASYNSDREFSKTTMIKYLSYVDYSLTSNYTDETSIENYYENQNDGEYTYVVVPFKNIVPENLQGIGNIKKDTTVYSYDEIMTILEAETIRYQNLYTEEDMPLQMVPQR